MKRAILTIALAVGCRAAPDPRPGPDRLPFIADGTPNPTFRFATPGVYYIWIRAASANGATLAYDLDGEQPLESGRGRIRIPAGNQWSGETEVEGFKPEVHVATPGDHTLHLIVRTGTVVIERVAMTLYHSARPNGDTLDHTGDPGGGRTTLPPSTVECGFREDRPSPTVRATRTITVKSGEPLDDRTFEPGDAVLLERGGRWESTFAPGGSGTSDRPITIGAYGEGPRPRLRGVRLRDQSHWIIQDLALSGDGFEALATGGTPQPRNVRLFNLVAFDCTGDGIHVGSDDDKGNGYDGVVIENCLSFCNGGDGIAVNGSDQNGCRNTVIRDCTAYSNPGMAGIWIHSGQNGLIERCRAYNNACVNIWTWNSINVTIRRCEAFRGRPQRDAAGFDIDWGCQACTIEYCHSHHNEGDGFLIMGNGVKDYRGFPMSSSHNILRGCVSEDNGQEIDMIETFDHGRVYNNSARGRTALKVGGWPAKDDGWEGGWPSHGEVVDNTFQGTVWVDDFATRQGNAFDRNSYPGRVRILWGGRENGPKFWEGSDEGTLPPIEYTSLEDFRIATGQEARRDPRRDPLTREWLAARRKFLTDTGAEAYGIPMEP